MPLSGSRQDQIQAMVEAAFETGQVGDLRAESERTLAHVNMLMGQKILSREESRAVDVAIEALVRIESIEQNKGMFFRAKRRMQLVQMYLGS